MLASSGRLKVPEREGILRAIDGQHRLLALHADIENFHDDISAAMIILNPLEPWPGRYVLPIANEFGIDVLARVVDYGGVFHDDVKPGHFFKDGDHRSYRAANWIEYGCEKMEKMGRSRIHTV